MRTWSDLGVDIGSHVSGEFKTTCPWCSHTRKKKQYPCLNVNLDKGVYHCWHCSASGGIAQGTERRPEITKTHRKPDYIAKAAPIPQTVEEWFASRGITKEVLTRNHVGSGRIYFPQVEEERGCVTFPYFRGTEVINVKYRTRDKLFRMESGCERILYGLNDIEATTIWVEGEIDKLSCEVAGMKNCVSVPDGAPAVTAKSYEAKFDFLAAEELDKATTHIIAVDGDAPGLKLRDELIRRLSPENCLVVDWPDGCKDANDVLIQLGIDALICCIRDARQLPIIGAHEVADYADELRTLYERGSPKGVSTGWPCVDQLYTIRSGEVTTVTGVPNAGKSEWLDALLVNLSDSQGWIFGVFSPENFPVPEHIKKLAEKRIGKPFEYGVHERMSSSEWDVAQSWLAHYFIFIAPEEPTLDSILVIAKQLVRRKGVRGIVIDPWNDIEHSRPIHMSETEYVSEALSKILRFAKTNGVHIWIVAHPTKLLKDKNGKYPVPTPYDISGSANWRNKSDNCITVWRDLDPREHSKEVEIHIQKIRHKIVGHLGMATLTYDRVTGRYREELKAVEKYANDYADR